ncbi:MAG: hypothetical protein H0V44_02780 [Planctomycetes bacterium]|nr:hypothetical protein [Planctomycetota bacterium]
MPPPAVPFIATVLTPDTAGRPGLGPERRGAACDADDVGARCDRFFATRLGHLREPHLRALALLWHDHLDAAHTLVQDLADADAAYVHAVMHRREPDYDNAKYWNHRVGPHPVHARLVADASWDPDAFVDRCERAESGCLEIQEREFRLLAEHLVGMPRG